ncbi:MAG: prolyl oligopeptidase family serine peptidase [Anaeromyxobacteraceae bacterium]
MFGWSFGGYTAARAVLERPDVFTAAVAGAPVTDWRDYDTFYTERYMGLPDADRAAYDAASLLPMAPRLSRPLLLIHGTADDNVWFANSLKLADALFRAARPFELLPVGGATHMVPDPVASRRVKEAELEFFTRHLAPAPAPTAAFGKPREGASASTN